MAARFLLAASGKSETRNKNKKTVAMATAQHQLITRAIPRAVYTDYEFALAGNDSKATGSSYPPQTSAGQSYTTCRFSLVTGATLGSVAFF